MGQAADKGILSLQKRYKDEHDGKVRNAQLSFTAGQFGYLERPSMIISVSKRLVTQSFNKIVGQYRPT